MEQIAFTYVVDDDPLYNFGAKKLLEMSDFTQNVSFFLNGELAWIDLNSRLEEDLPLPNVILLDINMPIMNGWQFLEKVSQINLNQPLQIYVVSSSINQEEIDKANKYEVVTDYIIKPLTLDSIKKLKKRIIDQQ